MNIDDARVLAINGAMLAEGRFEFEGQDADGFLRPENAFIAIREKGAFGGTEFALVGNAVRDADGFWTANSFHALTLTSAVPPFDRLLDYPSFALSEEGVPSPSCRFDIASEHSAFAWVAIDAVHHGETRRQSLLGMAASGSIEVQRDGDGFAFTIATHVERPKRGETPAAPVSVRVTGKLSYATMLLAGSQLWWRGGAERWDQESPLQSGPLAEALTLDRAGGVPYFRGTLDLGPNQRADSSGPWLQARLSEHRLLIKPIGTIGDVKGFVRGNSSFSPELVFSDHGFGAWKAMLGDGDACFIERNGAGIGYLDGVTGRDAGESGPHTQPIEALKLELFRSEQGVTAEFSGRLGAMRQTPVQPPFGPEFHGRFFVPVEYFIARGVDLPDQWRQRFKRLGK